MIASRIKPTRNLWKLLHSSAAVSARSQPKTFPSTERSTLSDEDDYYGHSKPPADDGNKRKFFGKQDKNFSLKKFTDAVRGDLPAEEEREIFTKQKPTWLKSDEQEGRSDDEQNSFVEHDEGPAEDESGGKRKTPQKSRGRKDVQKDALQEDKRTQFTYKFLDDKNHILRDTITDVRNRKSRMESRKILLEGHRLINEALINGVKLDSIFFTKEKVLSELSQEMLQHMRPKIYEISARQMGLWSDLTTPPGIIAVAKMPDHEVMDVANQMPLTVICDNIRDPTNMGAIIRVLAGASCKQIILVKGCVDPWDSKVLRSAMGAHFHIPIHYNVPWELVINYLDNPAQMFLAENLEPPGIDPTAVIDHSRWPRLTPRKQRNSLQTVNYYDADFAKEDSVTLILGGESEGVGEKAYEMTMEREGKRISIPLGNHIESLNAASAVAVIAFEMKRQLALSNSNNAGTDSDRE